MDYSLLSRLEGCLWGLVFGEQFGHTMPASNSLLPQTAIHRWHPKVESKSDVPWSQFCLQGLQTVARSQPDHLASTIASQLGQFPMDYLNTATLAMATLPIALYYHDDLKRQQHYLWQVLDQVAGAPASRDWVTVFAYAIAQAIKGQLQPRLLMSQLLAYYRIVLADAESSSAIVLQQLKQVETCQLDLASLGTILATLGQAEESTVAIALICFLQTPADLRVALARSLRGVCLYSLPAHASSLAALVGALVGAYASTASIPPSWKSATFAEGSAKVFLQQIPPAAELLYASWAGLYEPTTIAAPLAVVAPWVVRGR